MKEQYIKQVEKELHISRKARKEIIRDLNEIFASAYENGETEQQVIDRLGTPKEFAESTAEQLEINITSSKKRKWFISSVIALAVAIISFVLYGTTQIGNVQQGTIGQADAMSNIKIDSLFIIDVTVVLLIIGIVATAAAIILIVFSIVKNWS